MRILRLLFFLTAAVFLTAYAAEEPAPAPSAAAEFIRTSCETTLYPEVCYSSLSGYANAVQQDPARLAGAAIGVSLSRAAGMAIYLANLSRQAYFGGGGDPRAAAALRDCFSVFGDAVSQIRGSMKQMRRVPAAGGGGGGGEELRFQMSNVQTWMSAALTNEDTCTDGLQEVADGPMKSDVCDRTVEVKKVTSNALALVNSYVDKITSP
ncbi:hypothetical protein ABFS82_05G043800 [Erythranthe guttata]|uniref:Pectinesterase inhibitor domain-containing protein n=1 Tax=Erythranthe guttata TaxID=4155 RepID=A0A022QUA4_ERYGU|nr:PREDICTED: 21 kDa protein-like [Erythranthe guttata]EYU30100.1 hypothetical protein MIMGU_mgv1a013865mg [Erythranthe guttata]|eukprot:XP_012846224.1 PREDICTED: 21 kDa protein-like [Erythranthe guttata]